MLTRQKSKFKKDLLRYLPISISSSLCKVLRAGPAFPAIRWSVTSRSGLEPTDQGSTGVVTPQDGSKTSSRRSDQPWFALRERPGSTRYSFLSSDVRSADCVPHSSSAVQGVGGDEETRTPDPLLAKEMLFQLSYAPLQGPMITEREWWAFLDSNQRPLPYQGSALTN